MMFRSTPVGVAREASGFDTRSLLHIAMQIGLYHPPDREPLGLGVQSLRILSSGTTY